ncbi:protein FAM76B [Hyalella azteca]|uniref:Protein FAM76B n=1 Tax=Hyalella azteca TaxID=294128 RepID=A0A8B7NF09_HYAAZ|nr:protein FAM76B [Hyalella azteca]
MKMTMKAELERCTSPQDCAGCGKRIAERYLLKALELYWHEDCLKCGCCDCRLGEVGSTLFTKGNLILCKRDYLRLFGTTGYCSACSKVIPAFEMVMRARNNVYHLECFACQQCNHRFCVGDKFYLCDNKILCEYDYEERLVFASMACSPSSLAQLKRQIGGLESPILDPLPSKRGHTDHTMVTIPPPPPHALHHQHHHHHHHHSHNIHHQQPLQHHHQSPLQPHHTTTINNSSEAHSSSGNHLQQSSPQLSGSLASLHSSGQQSTAISQQLAQMNQQSSQINQQSPQINQQSPQMNHQSSQINQQSSQMNQQSSQLNKQSSQMNQQSSQLAQQSPQLGQQSPQVPASLGLCSAALPHSITA